MTLGLPSKFRSEKIPRNRLGMVFVIPRNKVLIPCDSEYFGRVHSITRNGTGFREILKFKEAPEKVVFSQVFSLPKMIRNGIPRYFFSENGSERNSEVFSSKNCSDRNSEGFSLSRNGSEGNSDGFLFPRFGSERNSEGVSLSRNGSERNSEGFSLPRNCSERNSEVFLVRETGGIPTELPSVRTCSEFRGIIFLSENVNPT